MNVLEFAKSRKGDLFPLTLFLLKCIYGFCLDGESQTIKLPNQEMVSEKEFLRWLYENNLCNVSEIREGHVYRDVVLVGGWGIGKTSLALLLAEYEAGRNFEDSVIVTGLYNRSNLCVPANVRVISPAFRGVEAPSFCAFDECFMYGRNYLYDAMAEKRNQGTDVMRLVCSSSKKAGDFLWKMYDESFSRDNVIMFQLETCLAIDIVYPEFMAEEFQARFIYPEDVLPVFDRRIAG